MHKPFTSKFIENDTYDNGFWLCTGPKKDLYKFCLKQFDDEPRLSIGCNGATILLENTDTDQVFNIVWIEDLKNNKDILIHELFHFVHMTLPNRGIHYCEETDEVYAYYIQWLFNQCIKPC